MRGKGWWEEEVIASRRKVLPFWHYSNFKRQFKGTEGLVGYKEGASYRIFKCLLSFYGPYWCQVLAWRGGGLARSRSWNRNYHYWLYIVCRSFAKGPPFEVLLVPFSPLFQKKVVPFWSPKGTFFLGDLTCVHCCKSTFFILVSATMQKFSTPPGLAPPFIHFGF